MAETNYLDFLLGLANVFSPQEAEAKVVADDPQAQALIDAVRSGAVMPGTREKDPLVSGRFDPLRKDIYRNVLQAAEDRPETVYVGTTDRPLSPEQGGAAGQYRSGQLDTIALHSYNPFYSASNRYTNLVPTAVNYQDSLSHELVHFLLQKLVPEIDKRGPQTWLKDFFLSKYPGDYQRMIDRGYGKLVSSFLGNAEGEHEFIAYLQGLAHAPIETGPTGHDQPALTSYKASSPLTVHPKSWTQVKRDVYTEALTRILQDPALLQQVLQTMEQGAR